MRIEHICGRRHAPSETVDVGDEPSLGFSRLIHLTEERRIRCNNVTAVRWMLDAAQNDTACNSLLFCGPEVAALLDYALGISRIDLIDPFIIRRFNAHARPAIRVAGFHAP
ncbi:hypothetical protein [Polaromonas sp. CF318]|uniref:hypothetical protein n=1 Tax=Polaromonas sp. CF318 TaxID=1144318 RepID=UPI0012F77177|nr:hypothetical protein [Polaromonas sp. CF318]